MSLRQWFSLSNTIKDPEVGSLTTQTGALNRAMDPLPSVLPFTVAPANVITVPFAVILNAIII